MIVLHELLSDPTLGAPKLGTQLEQYTLPESVTFEFKQRCFWYFPHQGINFREEDRTLKAYGKPLIADIKIIPKDPENLRRGVIDFVKGTVQIQVHVTHESPNR